MARTLTKFVNRDGRKFKVPSTQPEPTRLAPGGVGVQGGQKTNQAGEAFETISAPKRLLPSAGITPPKPPAKVDNSLAVPGAPKRDSRLQPGTQEQPKDKFGNIIDTGFRKEGATMVEELGAPDPISGISMEETIFLKKSRGESLSDEEKLFERKQLLEGFEDATDPFEDVGGVLGKRIETLEAEREAQKESLRTEREKRIAEKEKELGIEFEREETRLRDSGDRVKKASQSRTSFSGFGRSTASDEKQEVIQKDTEQAVLAADSRRKLQLQLFEAAEAGADEETLSGLSSQISNLKSQEIQFELDSAVRVAELNAENQVKGQEALDNLLQSFSTETQRTVDKSASELLGYVSDEFGNPIGDPNNPIPVNSEEEKNWGTFQDPFTGKTIFYNKNDPSETINAPGSTTRAFEQPDGTISSSPTSDGSDMTVVGQGEPFTRDNGTQGLLGENCVKYARSKVPNLPFGLNTKQDKIDAIKLAGETDTSLAQVGDAVLSGEGSWGHAYLIDEIDPETGEWILDEANYQSGQVTHGRRIDPNDPSIFGFVSATTGPQQSSQVSDNRNEGNNAGIDVQVLATTAVDEIKFGAVESREFRQYLKDGTLPKRLKFPAQQQAFQQKAEVFSQQTKDDPIKLEPKEEFKFTQDLKKNFESIAKEPKKAITQIGLIRIASDKAKKDLAAGQSINAASQGILVPFQKMLDPTSVVRESEYARSGSGQALLQQLDGKWQTLKQGGAGVTGEGLIEFVETAELFMTQYENALIDAASPIQFSANRFSLPIEGILDPTILKLIERRKAEQGGQGGGAGDDIDSLAAQQNFNIEAARAAGATDDEIREILTQ